MARLLRAIAPAEWAALAFVGYLLARGVAGSGAFAATALPRLDVVVVLLGIATFRVLRRYRATPWRAEHRAVGRAHVFALPVLLAPALLILVAGRDKWPDIHEDDAVVGAALLARAWSVHAGQLLIPPVFVWLATGLDAKEAGSFSVARTVRGGWAAAFGTARDWLPPLLLIYAYGFMATLMTHPTTRDLDAELFAIDRVLAFGHEPVLEVQRLVTPLRSEVMALAYVSYAFFFPVVLGAVYAVGSREQFREAAFATTFALAVGYTGYTLVPAQGPLFTLHYDAELTHYTLRRIQEQLMDRHRVPRDCFPSLHTGMSWLMTYEAWRHAPRWLFWVLAPFAALIPVSCIYLRYHYLVDVLAGALLAVATAALGRYLARRGVFA